MQNANKRIKKALGMRYGQQILKQIYSERKTKVRKNDNTENMRSIGYYCLHFHPKILQIIF